MKILPLPITMATLGCTLVFTLPAAERWTLSTDDTAVTIEVADNRPAIVGLAQVGSERQWVPSPSPLPLPGKGSVRVGKDAPDLAWTFTGAEEDRTKGHRLVLRFTCAQPKLELTSTWQALPGGGPVENLVNISNRSGSDVVFTRSVPAGALQMRADAPLAMQYADKTDAGVGKVHDLPVAAKANLSTRTGHIPFIILHAGQTHGVYLGFEWELGGFQVQTRDDPLAFSIGVASLTNDVSCADGTSFMLPAVYYGTYQGEVDDGANRFKRWFWDHKITRSLHDHADEPWVQVCMQDLSSPGGATSITGSTPQSSYDRLAATGVECVKMDFWDGTGKCWYTNRDWQFKPQVWPNGFDFRIKANKAGLKASLYMGGTYLDGDLNTIEARDRQLAALIQRYEAGWFDMWRTDKYNAPHEPMPGSYQGVTNFLHIQDQLIGKYPGYRYENCSNGGKFKGFAICRRMTFCTMNDKDQDPVLTRTTYWSNTFAINPVQLKSDLGPAKDAYYLRTDMLGSILTWAADNPVYRQHIALYKARQRPILRGGNVYHILPMPDGKNWDGLQFHHPDLDRGSVFLFKPSAEVPETMVIRLKGLKRQKTYRVAFQDAVDRTCSLSGAALMDQGIPVSLKGANASEILWLDCPELSVSSDRLTFSAEPGQAAPPTQTLTLTYEYGPAPEKPFVFTADAPWLRLSTQPGGQAVSVDPAGLKPGIHRSRILISRPDLPDRLWVPVELRLQSALYARWTFDEVSGDQALDAVGDHPGTLVGNPERIAGRMGKALRLNGKGQFVQTKAILDDLAFPCSFTCWVDPGPGQAAHADLFGNHGQSGGLVMQQDGGKTNQFWFGTVSPPKGNNVGPVVLKPGRWQHVAVVGDGREIILYLDGKEAVRGPGGKPLLPNPALGFQIGNGFADQRCFTGAIDDVRIYSRALTPTEIANLAADHDAGVKP